MLNDIHEVPSLVKDRIRTAIEPDAHLFDVFFDSRGFFCFVYFRCSAYLATFCPVYELKALFPFHFLLRTPEEIITSLIVPNDPMLMVLDTQNIRDGIEQGFEKG